MSNEQMQKPEQFPKKNIFEVPDGYFDKLPGIIQARVAKEEKATIWSGSWGLALRFAVPMVVLLAAGVYWFKPTPQVPVDVQAALAQFRPEQLKEYLDHHDLYDDGDQSVEEIVESRPWSAGDVRDLEQSVYSGYGATREEIQNVLDEFDSEL